MGEAVVNDQVLETLQGLLELVNLKRHIAKADGERDLIVWFDELGSNVLVTHKIAHFLLSDASIKITFQDCQKHFLLIHLQDGRLIVESYRHEKMPCSLEKTEKETF